jgi:hypothetical protein
MRDKDWYSVSNLANHVIICDTDYELDEVLQILEDEGWIWATGDKPTLATWVTVPCILYLESTQRIMWDLLPVDPRFLIGYISITASFFLGTAGANVTVTKEKALPKKNSMIVKADYYQPPCKKCGTPMKVLFQGHYCPCCEG